MYIYIYIYPYVRYIYIHRYSTYYQRQIPKERGYACFAALRKGPINLWRRSLLVFSGGTQSGFKHRRRVPDYHPVN